MLRSISPHDHDGKMDGRWRLSERHLEPRRSGGRWWVAGRWDREALAFYVDAGRGTEGQVEQLTAKCQDATTWQ